MGVVDLPQPGAGGERDGQALGLIAGRFRRIHGVTSSGHIAGAQDG
jgi:hypothetical protein